MTMIDHGTYSKVYEDELIIEGTMRLTKKVARKRFNETRYISMPYLNELDILMRLRSSPGILYLEDFNPDELSLLLERMDGSLVNWFIEVAVEERPSLLPKLFESILSAISTLHSLGIIHNDIKPGNILYKRVHGDYTIFKLADFGMSGNLIRLEAQRNIGGTYCYASPQALITHGESVRYEVERNDIWSFGLVLLEAFRGTYPFTGGIHVADRKKILHSITSLFPEERRYILSVIKNKENKFFSILSPNDPLVTLIPATREMLSLSSIHRFSTNNTNIYKRDQEKKEIDHSNNRDVKETWNQILQEKNFFSVNTRINCFATYLRLLQDEGVVLSSQEVRDLANLIAYQYQEKDCEGKVERKQDYSCLLRKIGGYFCSNDVLYLLNKEDLCLDEWYDYLIG